MADCNFILAIGLHAQSLILSKIQLTLPFCMHLFGGKIIQKDKIDT